MLQSTGKYLDTAGYKTHYIEAGGGEPLILIHGGGAGADSIGNWSGCLPRYAAADWRAIAYDMVGFGHSDAPDPANCKYTQDTRVAQLIAFIEGMGFKQVNIVGNSMGGATTLGLAMRRPELIKNMVLMGSAGLNHHVGGALTAIMNYDFTVEGMKKVVAALTNPGFKATPELLEYRHRVSLDPKVRAAYGATMGWVKQQGGLFYPEPDIAKIKNRTLVVNGKDDQIIPMMEAFKFLQLLENSAGYMIPHCGHWAMIEHPETFTAVTDLFFKGSDK